MKGAWSWVLLAPPLAMALLFFVGPLVYLFYVSLQRSVADRLVRPCADRTELRRHPDR